MIEEGAKAPDFTMPTDGGGEVSLAALAGKTVVLYFYPRDDTPGCTKEACAFRDRHPALEKLDAVVIGDPLRPGNDCTLLVDLGAHVFHPRRSIAKTGVHAICGVCRELSY